MPKEKKPTGLIPSDAISQAFNDAVDEKVNGLFHECVIIEIDSIVCTINKKLQNNNINGYGVLEEKMHEALMDSAFANDIREALYKCVTRDAVLNPPEKE